MGENYDVYELISQLDLTEAERKVLEEEIQLLRRERKNKTPTI